MKSELCSWLVGLEEDQARAYDNTVLTLQERLDPGSKVLGEQDFQHAFQRDNEPIADFVRKLQRTFNITYGRDRMSKETKEAILFGHATP
jgi:hypothetical protein